MQANPVPPSLRRVVEWVKRLPLHGQRHSGPIIGENDFESSLPRGKSRSPASA
jgi:hypothetical protein